jgi:dTMP kinase
VIIGVEGVSCVGKTMLSRALADALGGAAVVACYYHAAPDLSWLPDLESTTAATQLTALTMLLRIEALRHERVLAAAPAGRHVILDRTVDTLLAHAHAVGRLHGFDVDRAARRLVDDAPAAVPDVTLLLRADPQVIEQRATHRVGMPPLLYDRTFTRFFHEHFTAPVVAHCVGVDANDPVQLLHTARSWLRGHASGDPGAGEAVAVADVRCPA